MTQAHARLPLVACLLALLHVPAPAQAARRLDDRQLEALAQRLAAWDLARDEALGVEQARAELAKELERLAKEHAGWDPLRDAADLGRAWWLGRCEAGPRARPGKLTTEVFEPESFGGAGLALAYRLPKDYEQRGRAWPLILSIPDFDEEPEQHLRTHWTLPALLDGAILVSPRMPSAGEDWAHVAVRGRPGGLVHVLAAVRIASRRFAVDPDRVYVVGRGKGVPAALAAGNVAPQRFAGVAGRAGDAGELSPANFPNLPVLLAGGGARASAFVEAARALGYDTCRAEPAAGEAQLWRWMLDHPRRTRPARVVIAPGDPFPTRAHWLQIAPSHDDATVTATLDRGAGLARIDGPGAHGATLFLDDALLDLDQPVRLVCNGMEASSRVERSLHTALELLREGTSDPACVYVGRLHVDLTAQDAADLLEPPGERDPQLEERLAAAGQDPTALWELHLWCTATRRAGASRRILRRLLQVAPDHQKAREALGHVYAAGAWFPSQQALARFRRSQEPQVAKARGYVLSRSLWVHPDERAYVTKGWIQDPETGQWLTLDDQRRLAQGWVRQDLQWIAPEEAHRADAGLWKVEGEWVDLATANRRRARIGSMWVIPGPEVLLHTTVERDVALRAMEHMERAVEDLRRVFGAQPLLPIRVALLRDEEQYDRLAFGDPDGRRRPAHSARLHVVHTAYLAESWFPKVQGETVFRGMGVGYWDTAIPHGDAYGVHSARLAAGLSYVDALDPSPKAVRKVLSKGLAPDHLQAYEAEKRMPAWLRYGGAVYAERYFRDATVPDGGDPWWARRWSLDNLRGRGGLRTLDEVFAFRLDPDDRDDGLKLLIEAGLLVAFAVDGECAPVAAALTALQAALAAGKLDAEHARALAAAIAAHERELRAFAGRG